MKKPKIPTAAELAKYPGFPPEVAKEFRNGYNAALKKSLKQWQPPKRKPN